MGRFRTAEHGFAIRGLVALAGFGLMQFVRLDRQNARIDETDTIETRTQVPVKVAGILHRACRDCHTEQTVWPWYSNVAPMLWLMAADVNTGREHMNLSRWRRYRGTNQEFATKYMWWFFLIQAYPLPEHMIGLDPKFYLQHIFEALNKMPGAIGPDEMNEYTRAFSNDATIHAACEDFRAAADIDLEMDQADEKVGRKIQCPVHALWGAKRTVGVLWDVIAT